MGKRILINLILFIALCFFITVLKPSQWPSKVLLKIKRIDGREAFGLGLLDKASLISSWDYLSPRQGHREERDPIL